ncbi:MAG: helix-turn-helix domain-containing protein, partial [Campylobacter sp.]|nr:helix-turn-helix domain-containing protein [Campylobacter sp.]
LKHSQSANILNITPETFSRIISKFKRLELLISEKGKIVDFKNELEELYLV